ncbi:MAG: 4Fe-4S binding protein [Deltaproteobacteria bacterium]|nr:4Fe-4S binding protein [Deltaproteobacteria bacterium]
MSKKEEKIERLLSKTIDPVYKELAAKIGEENSRFMPHVFEAMANPEQAKIMNELPRPLEEIAEKLGLDKKTVEQHIQILFEKGLLFPGKTGWHLTRSWGALHDSAGASNPKHDDDDFFDLAFAKSMESNQWQIQEVKEGKKQKVRQIMRVIPRWESIRDVPGVLPHEDTSAILKHAEPIAQMECACKKIHRERECEGKIPTNTCFTIGRPAQYNIDRGAGKKLSYEEAMAIMAEFDKYPLVHLTGNTNQIPYLLCNCHNCCCGVFIRNTETKKLFNQHSLAKSRFIAVVDAEKCKGCGLCMKERCPVDAIQMKFYPEYDEERSFINEEECIGCGLCVVSCPAEARTMKLVRPPDHIPEPGSEPYATA